MLLHRKSRPLDLIVLHYILSLLHAELLVKSDRIIVGDQINRDVLLPACDLMGACHQAPADAVSLVGSVYAQIRDVKPVGKIRQTKQNADCCARLVPGDKTYGGVLYQFCDPLIKPLFRVLGT